MPPSEREARNDMLPAASRSDAGAGPPSERILILDFGSQYTQLIARRIRECHVYCEIHPHRMSAADVRAFAPAGIVLSGSPSSVLDAGSPQLDPGVLRLGVPVLAICYGLQLLRTIRGRVERTEQREYGRAPLSSNATTCSSPGRLALERVV